MSPTLLCVIVYDVPDNRRRTRLFKLLKLYGTPVQRSAFEAHLTAGERVQLQRELTRLLHADEDRLILYPVAREQERRLHVIGPARPPPPSHAYTLI